MRFSVFTFDPESDHESIGNSERGRKNGHCCGRKVRGKVRNEDAGQHGSLTIVSRSVLGAIMENRLASWWMANRFPERTVMHEAFCLS